MCVCVCQLYWVTGVQQQSRVVARSDAGIYVSIPRNYDRLFHRVSAAHTDSAFAICQLLRVFLSSC